MSPEFYKHLLLEKARTLWCILVDKNRGEGSTLIMTPMKKPYAVQNRKVVEDTAKIISKQHPTWKLEVRTMEDAFNYLLKKNPEFERDLLKRL